MNPQISISEVVGEAMKKKGIMMSVLHVSPKLSENADCQGVFDLFEKLKYK